MATAIVTHKQPVTKALDRVISIDEKRRLMLIEVLREESGRELEAQARFSNGEIEFDWKEHNSQFRIDYADASLKELLEYARKLYGQLTLMQSANDAPNIKRKSAHASNAINKHYSPLHVADTPGSKSQVNFLSSHPPLDRSVFDAAQLLSSELIPILGGKKSPIYSYYFLFIPLYSYLSLLIPIVSFLFLLSSQI